MVSERTQLKYGKRLSVNLWADVVERIDILLLEIRHLQLGIIYGLKAPEVLRLLRFEEWYIWGHIGHQTDGPSKPDWTRLFNNLDFSQDQLPAVAAAWILPTSKNGDQFYVKTPFFDDSEEERQYRLKMHHSHVVCLETRTKTIKRVESFLLKARSEGQWTSYNRSVFYDFQAFQRIKRNLLLLKLQCCWWGCWAHDMLDPEYRQQNDEPGQRIAHFLVVRAATLSRVNDYVERVGDLQTKLEKTIDLGRQDHQRPTASRRRQQGIYSTFLAKRSRQIVADTSQLLQRLGLKQPRKSESNFGTRPVLTHNWHHNHTSQWREVIDFVSRSMTTDRRPPIAVQSVQSSYWMPDRPDLQPAIGHEAAHLCLNRFLKFNSSAQLEAQTGKLASLLRDLSHCLTVWSIKPFPDQSDIDEYPAILEEITCDLLATAIFGHSYLFTLVQEVMGRELDMLLELPNGEIDPSIATEIWRMKSSYDVIHCRWYIRILICCNVLESFNYPEQKDELGKQLSIATLYLSEQILSYLDKIATDQKQQKKSHTSIWIRYWSDLARQLSKIVKRSDALKIISRFHADRQHKETLEFEAENHDKKFLLLQRSIEPLDSKIREYLLEFLISKKLKANRLNKEQDKIKGFTKNYFSKIVSDNVKESDELFQQTGIFRSVYDIPWHCALLRADDFLEKASSTGGSTLDKEQEKVGVAEASTPFNWPENTKPPPRTPNIYGKIDELINDYAPGRELFMLGIELELYGARQARDDLPTIINLAQQIVESSESNDPGSEEISNWLGDDEPPDSNKLYQDIKKTVDKIELQIKENKSKKFEMLKEHFFIIKVSAKDLSKLIIQISSGFVDKKENRNVNSEIVKLVLDKYIEFKIDDLAKILYKLSEKADYPDNIKQNIQTLKEVCLQISNPSIRKEARNKTLEAFKLDDNYNFEIDDFSFIAKSGYYYGKKNSNQPGDTIKFNYKKNCSQLFTLLGRLDHIECCYSKGPLYRSQIPLLSVSHKNISFKDKDSNTASILSENFYPFIEKRQHGMCFRLGNSISKRNLEQNFYAMVAIVLNRPADRIDFLARLVNSNSTEFCDLYKNDYLDERFDYGYLMEGTEDIILILNGGNRDVDKILSLSTKLYQNFLVDRTETIFSFEALMHLIDSGKGDSFQIVQEIRLMENRNFYATSEKFGKRLSKQLNEIFGSSAQLIHMPGLSDYMINIPVTAIKEIIKSNGEHHLSREKVFNILFQRLYGETSGTEIPLWNYIEKVTTRICKSINQTSNY